MFWSLILEPGKRYTSTVKESFHLSTATLDVKTVTKDNDVHPVSIEIDGQELLLCNLSKSQHLHANLDLVFQKGTDITFSTSGKAVIHLTGYCIQDDLSDDGEDFSDSELDESDSDSVEAHGTKQPEFTNKKNESKNKKNETNSKNAEKQIANKRKLQSADAVSNKKPKKGKLEEDDDDDDSSADLDESELGKLVESLNNEDDSDSDNEVDDSDLDDSGEDDSDDDDNEEDDDEDDDDDSEDEDDKPKQPLKKEVKPISKQNTPAKQQNKNQIANGVTPQSNKKDKNKNQANQPTPKQDGQKTPKQDNQKSPKKGETPQSQKKQTLSGGVVVEDLKIGNGPVAKNGRMVQVYYTGRLKSNNRVFDSSTQGPGFKFKLGHGEVIKAWDVALNGMKVGSKRRITCPPGMAYGQKGSPPQIPPNSWLIFDVELKSVI